MSNQLILPEVKAENHGLLTIKSSGLLPPEHMELLEAFGKELHDTFVYSQQHRTRTEMEVSVLDDIKFPTPDAKYWQAVREQDVFFTQLVMLSYEYRKLIVEQKKLEKKLDNEEDLLECELIQIEIERINFLLEVNRREAYHRVREISEWSDIKSELAKHCRFPLNDVNAHQLTSYRERFRRQFEMLNGNENIADRLNVAGLHKTTERRVKEVS